MTNERSARVPPTPFERWVQTEGLKVVTRHTIHNILTEPLEPWERTAPRGRWQASPSPETAAAKRVMQARKHGSTMAPEAV